jgi:hypothetical protein
VKKIIFLTTAVILMGMAIAAISLAGDTDSVTGTVTVQNISVSLDQTSFAYGTMANNAASTTLTLWSGAGITATNDGNVTEDFDIYGADTTDWTLAGSAGSDQYIHQFCNDTDDDCSTPPTNYSALTTSPATLKNSINTSGTCAFQLRINTPNPSTVYTQQSADVTVQASAS